MQIKISRLQRSNCSLQNELLIAHELETFSSENSLIAGEDLQTVYIVDTSNMLEYAFF